MFYSRAEALGHRGFTEGGLKSPKLCHVIYEQPHIDKKEKKKDSQNLVFAIMGMDGGLGLLGPPLFTARTLN